MPESSVFARVHVLVVCDAIEQPDSEDRVVDLRGVRTGVQADSFPYCPPALCVYIQVSGHEGTASGEVVVVREADDHEIVSVPINDLELRGPLTMVQVGLRTTNCKFPAAGIYWFQVVLNQKLVAERRFRVHSSESSNGQPTG